ncbi:MAG: aspartate--tRNA ligase [Patescibacteria group bacterium]
MHTTRTIISQTPDLIGKSVTLKGWVHSKRNMGKIVFIDLRDAFGLLQVVFAGNEELQNQADQLKPESVIELTGTIAERNAKNVNDKIATGGIELQAETLAILNESETPPFEINRENVEDEELRLKYRYLDIRHDRLHQNLKMRHQVFNKLRNLLDAKQFVEVETPLLTAPTPEGARDFLVPSRKSPGSFYALPQSPQQYKQLLMAAGIERYYQIAKCMRDEDSRGDRQPEFTQLDMEMSFVDREEVIQFNEQLMIDLIESVYPDKKIQTKPFPRITYKEAMEKYGSDRPDLREDKNDPNLLAFCWVIDFPMFEKTDDGWTFSHNPFSAPMPEHMDDLLAGNNVENIMAAQYDVILNGFELGGGSIRNHQPAALKATLKIMGYDDKKAESDFGHMMTAFTYGTPPHGGIAWGLDRLVMILQNEPNIREVIAFPKTDSGRDPMMESPRAVDTQTLSELGLKTK